MDGDMDIDTVRAEILSQVVALRRRGMRPISVQLGRSQTAVWRGTYPTGGFIELWESLGGPLLQLDVDEIDTQDRIAVVGEQLGPQPTGPLPPPH
jgi:hypothetical protein